MARSRSRTTESNGDEFARRADALYDQHVKPRVTADDVGKFVAIDVDTGAYELDVDEVSAVDRLLAREPGASVWLTRVGSRHAHRFGGSAIGAA